MRVLFVYPDHMHGLYKPIGISLLSAVIKQHGHCVEVFDMSDYDDTLPESDQGVDNLMFKNYELPDEAKTSLGTDPFKGFREKVQSFNPDIIAVSVTYLLYQSGIKLIEYLGSKRKAPTIFGGIHVTLNPEDVIRDKNVDMICRGEGEDAFVELLDKMSRGDDITDIPNIWTKKNARVIKNELREYRHTLDNLPFVDWSIYPESHFYKPYRGKVYRSGDLIATRGCPMKCSYCFYHAYYDAYGTKNHVIYKSPDRVMEELNYVYREYGVRLVKMRDADFTMIPANRLKEMAEIYKAMSPEMPEILINSNAHTVTREKVKYLKDMNLLSVTIGLESGSDYLRREYLNRRHSNEKFIDSVKHFREFGIRVATSNMIGIPHETRENIFETISLNKTAKIDLADVSILFPFPGTQIYEYCKDKGLLRIDLSDSHYYRSEPILDMEQISKKELSGLMKTFQLYMHSPKILYPLIARAERDDLIGKKLQVFLKKVFYLYIFYMKEPIMNIYSNRKVSFNGNGIGSVGTN